MRNHRHGVEASQNSKSFLAPKAPTNVVISNQGTNRPFGDGLLLLTFTPNPNGSPATSYQVVSSYGSNQNTYLPGQTILINGLTGGLNYQFRVRAVNEAGISPWSTYSPAVKVTTLPADPTFGTPTNVTNRFYGDGAISIPFTMPADGGAPPVTIFAIPFPNGPVGYATASPAIVGGLNGGSTYYLKLSASNVNGATTLSAATDSVTIYTAPEKPTISSFVAVNDELTVTFTDNGGTGGSPVLYTTTKLTDFNTGLTIEQSNEPSPIVFNSNINYGTKYKVEVFRTNAYGDSEKVSTTVTTQGNPPHLHTVVATPLSGSSISVLMEAPIYPYEVLYDLSYGPTGSPATFVGYYTAAADVAFSQEVTISGLSPSVEYTFILSDGTIDKTTTATTLPLSAPGQINLVGNTTVGSTITSFAQNWTNNPTSYETKITSTYGEDPTESSTTVATGESQASYTITKLDTNPPPNRYRSFVRATNANGTSAWFASSAILIAQPLVGAISITEVANTATTTTLTVRIQVGISSYERYFSVSANDVFKEDYSVYEGDSLDTQYTLTGLTPGGTYVIKLDDGEFNTTVSATTLGPPTNGQAGISGVGMAGTTLTATTSNWLGAPLSYETKIVASTVNPPVEYNSTKASSLYNSVQYTITADDAADPPFYFRAFGRSTNAYGTSEWVGSDTIIKSYPIPLPSGGSVTLTGNSTYGSTITASTSGWTGATSYEVKIVASTATPVESSVARSSTTTSTSTSTTILQTDALSPVVKFKAFARATGAGGTSAWVESGIITTTAGTAPSGGSVTLSGTGVAGTDLSVSVSGWSDGTVETKLVANTSTPVLVTNVTKATGTTSFSYTVTTYDATSPAFYFKAFSRSSNYFGTSAWAESGTILSSPAATSPPSGGGGTTAQTDPPTNPPDPCSSINLSNCVACGGRVFGNVCAI